MTKDNLYLKGPTITYASPVKYMLFLENEPIHFTSNYQGKQNFLNSTYH